MDTKVRSPNGQKKRTPIPQGARFNILKRDNFTCRYCGRSSPEVILHIDHAVSVKNGGPDSEDNLVTACFDCNSGKSSKTVKVDIPVKKDRENTREETSGLVGLWGHTFTDDDSFPDRKMIQKQFKIIRQITPQMYMCQLFSWMDGCPTNCEMMTTDVLVEDCKLYASNEQMLDAYDKECRLRKRKADDEGGWLAVYNKKIKASADQE